MKKKSGGNRKNAGRKEGCIITGNKHPVTIKLSDLNKEFWHSLKNKTKIINEFLDSLRASN